MVQAPTAPHPLDHGPRTELVERRTADSRTFRNADGTLTSDYFSAPAFYETAPGVFESIDTAPVASDVPGKAYETKAAPTTVRFGDSSTIGDLVTIEGAAYSVRYRAKLPGILPDVPIARATAPEADGQHVTYRGVYPGVDLRYSLLSDGVKEDIVLNQPGTATSFAFVLDAPGLSSAIEADGSVSIRRGNTLIFTVPAPFMVDSAPERDGDGVRTDAVSYRLVDVAGATVLVVDADPAWLADPDRVYPVYIDPTTYNAQYAATLDTFISSAYPTQSLNAQWNPNEGGYYELWNGRYDNGSGTNYAYVKTGIPTSKTIISATFKIYVQHSYMGATATGISIGRLTSAFTESQTWNMTQPSHAPITSTTVADNHWASFNVKSTVEAWEYGTATNHGFRIYQASTSQSLWKRLRARENGSNPTTNKIPYLTVSYAEPLATPVSPTGGSWTKSTALDWSYSDEGSGLGQGTFRVQVSTSSTTWSGTPLKADSQNVASSATSWTAPASSLTNGTTYYWRVRSHDGHEWSAWSAAASFKYDTLDPGFTVLTTPVTGAVTAADPVYYDTGTGAFTIKIRGSDAHSAIDQTYLSLYSPTFDDLVVFHDWSVGGAHCSEQNPSTQVDATSCSESYNSGGTREVTFTVTGLGPGATFAMRYALTDTGGMRVPDSGYADAYAPSKTLIFDAVTPTASFTSPAASSAVNGSVPLTGTASDVNFLKYELHYGAGATPSTWTAIGAAVTTPVSDGLLGTWNTSSLVNGTYTIRLRVYDKARATSGFTEITRPLTVDGTLPVANLTAPLANAHVKASVPITGTASASAGFVNYTLDYGSGCAPVVPSWTNIVTSSTQVTNGTLGTWNTGSLNGFYKIRLVTTKAGGVSKTTTSCVVVDNTAPTGAITTPVTNGPVAGMVPIEGSAGDNLGFKEYQVEFAPGTSPTIWTTVGTFSTAVSSGSLASWDSAGLNGVYTIRLTVRDQAGNAPLTITRLLYLENARRGEESYYTRVPFDLGGGLQLGVGVANGELTLDRDLFAIPSYGPPQALSLSYSSLEATNAGRFGYGWSSNLTQYLSFESGFVVWHRADGGRVPFGNVAGSWTPLTGHFETLAAGSGTYTITLKDQTKLIFADVAPGRLTKIENRFGKALTLTWNTSSATATDASGRSTTIAIDAANNRISAATDSAGRGWGFGYSAANDLTSITDPASAVTTLAYDGSHRLTSVSRIRTPASGLNETIAWTVGYTSGKVSNVTDPVSSPTPHTFSYAPGSTTASLLRDTLPDPDVFNVTSYTLDASGRVTTWTDPEGWSTTQTFDPAGNLLSITRPIDQATSATTTYIYDGRGNVLSEITPLDGSTTVTTAMTYNATNDLLTRDEADGTAIEQRTVYTYDAGQMINTEVNPQLPDGPDGQIVTTYSHTANGQVEIETDPLGRKTKFGYDSHGNRTSEIHNFVSGQSANADRNVTTTYVYDQATAAGKAGRPTSRTNPVGNTEAFAYDLLGRKTSETLPGDASLPALSRATSYDQFGNPLTVSENWAGASRTTTFAYDKLNRKTSETDPLGAMSSTTYDAAGNVVAVTADGMTTTGVFDGLGRLVTEASPTGAATNHTYDAQGREISVTVAAGLPTTSTTTRVFDLAGRMTSEVANEGELSLMTAYVYDAFGQVTEITDPDGLVTIREVDRVGRVTESDSGLTVTDYTFDKVGNLLSEEGPRAPGANGPITEHAYDALNREVERVVNADPGSSDPDANLTTTWFYDSAGRVLAHRDPSQTVTRSVFNVRGLVTQTIDNCTDVGTLPSSAPPSCIGAGTHDGSTNRITDLIYDGSGALVRLTRQTSTGGIVTETNYDDAGRVIRRVQDKAIGGLNITTEYAYDSLGRLSAVRDPRGTVKRNFYDEDGRLIATIENCTNVGQVVLSTGWDACAGTGSSDATWNVRTSYAYDTRGNLISQVAPNGRETRFGYDGADRLTWQTENYVDNPLSPAPTDVNLTTYFYSDEAGRQVAVKSPTTDGDTFAVTRFFLDDMGRQVKVVWNCTSSGTQVPADPPSCTGLGTANASTNVTRTYEYDAIGQRTSETAPDPSLTGLGTPITSRYAYDGAGRLCHVVDNTNLQALACTTTVTGSDTQNISTRYAYDKIGNLTSMVDGEEHTTHYTHDRGGRMTGRTDANGEEVVWQYDVRGNRIAQINRSDATPGSPTVTWTYDAADRMASRDGDGQTVTYAHDESGNRISSEGSQGEITATYDRLNRPLVITAEDGSTTTMAYDFAAISRVDSSGSYAIDLDAFGREISLTDPIHAGSPFTTSYRSDGKPEFRTAPNGNETAFSFDAVGNLTALTTTGAGGTPSRAAYTYTYNPAGLRVAESSTVTGDPTNGTIAYAYDQLARVTMYARSGGVTQAYDWGAVPNRESVQVGAGSPTTTTYDPANRPTAESTGGAFSHDLDGQLTARAGQILEWDSLGRLVKVRPSGGGNPLATYTYDALDRLRIVDYGGNNRVRFRYVGMSAVISQVVNDGDGSVISNIASSLNGELLMDWTAGGASQRIYGTNAHHDLTWTAGPTGLASGTRRYDPWGVVISSTGSMPDFRYQSSWQDPSTGLLWAMTRWYAPPMGRFISEDALLGIQEVPASRHLYAYGAGDPVDRWDPTGMCSPYAPWQLDCTVGDFDGWTAAQRDTYVKNWQAYYAPKWFNAIRGVLQGAALTGAIQPRWNWFSRVDAFILAAIQDGQRLYQGRRALVPSNPANEYWKRFYRGRALGWDESTLRYLWGTAEQLATDYGVRHTYRWPTYQQVALKSTTDIWRAYLRVGGATKTVLNYKCSKEWWYCPSAWAYNQAYDRVDSVIPGPRSDPSIIGGLFSGLWTFFGVTSYSFCRVVFSPLTGGYLNVCN